MYESREQVLAGGVLQQEAAALLAVLAVGCLRVPAVVLVVEVQVTPAFLVVLAAFHIALEVAVGFLSAFVSQFQAAALSIGFQGLLHETLEQVAQQSWEVA